MFFEDLLIGFWSGVSLFAKEIHYDYFPPLSLPYPLHSKILLLAQGRYSEFYRMSVRPNSHHLNRRQGSSVG